MRPILEIVSAGVADTNVAGRWHVLSNFATEFNVSYSVEESVAATASAFFVEGTLANPFLATPTAASIFVIETSALGFNGTTTEPIMAIRVRTTLGSGASSTVFRMIQQGV